MNALHQNEWTLYEKAMRDATCGVAVDVGANDGGYAATLLDNGFTVYAFEPVPRMFYKLANRFMDIPEVICRPIALSDKPEVIENCQVMHCWTLGDPAKVGMSISPDFATEPPFKMFCDTLDNQLAVMGVEKVGIIKLDCDGYEYKVLRGAEDTLKRDHPPILCEFSEYIARLGEKPEDFVNYIFHLGYKVVSMDGKNEFTTWESVKPYWPYSSSFDVVLLPR